MSSTATTTTSTTEEELILPIPNEWLDYLYNQQFNDIGDWDVPFAGTAVSDDISFGHDAMNLGADYIFCTPCDGGSDFSASSNIKGPTANSSCNTTTMAAATTVIIAENSTMGSSNNSNSNSNSNTNSNAGLSPKAGIAKQVKRRSRASRRTPTILLKATIKNFRTVVQQYTGCLSSNSGFSRNGKGPIILNFDAPSNHRNDFPASFYFHGQYDQHQVDPFLI